LAGLPICPGSRPSPALVGALVEPRQRMAPVNIKPRKQVSERTDKMHQFTTPPPKQKNQPKFHRTRRPERACIRIRRFGPIRRYHLPKWPYCGKPVASREGGKCGGSFENSLGPTSSP